MKTVLLAGSALAAASICAADPVHAQSPVPYRWSGCYVGGHVGLGTTATTLADPSGFNFTSPAGQKLPISGGPDALGGVQAGCDQQFASNWVIGLAGDFSWANLGTSGHDPYFSGKQPQGVTASSRIDQIATITGRVGYAWDRAFLYGKAGAAYGNGHADFDNLRNLTTNNVSFFGCGIGIGCTATGKWNDWGWTAGFGLEYALLNNWSVFGEYNHYDFGSKTISMNIPSPGYSGPQNLPLNIENRIDVFKFGLNYRFGSLWR